MTFASLNTKQPTTHDGASPPSADFPSRKLRVCHLSMTLQIGGLERLLVDFGKFHDRDQFDLSFVALGELGLPADDLREYGYPVQSMNIQKSGKLWTIRKLRNYLRQNQIDILHTHNTYPQFYGSLAARWADTPVILNTQHGRGCGFGWKPLVQFQLANRFTDTVIGVSEDAAAICREQDLIAADKIGCIWNGIDVDRFQYHGPADELTAISVGRLSPEKGLSTLLHALPYVLKEHPGFRVKIVGDGAERAPLEALSSELALTDNVEFLGERKDIPELLRTAGFYVASSKTEGISLTLLEAMAVGLPIVTTEVGGNPEIVVPNETGKLVPPLNPDALATAICEMIEERALWPDYGQRARARVEENFNIRKMVAGYEDLYRSCYRQKRSTS
ncbi:MAG: glycosyltransferase [Planctomycetaceae bacterium]|nr:glycosyltransferase [Planctomycetaceae bacterium]